MTAATVNFVLYPHATFTETVTLRNSDGTVMNLTGYSARAQVRREIDDTDAVFDLSSTNGKIVLGGAAGTVQFLLANTETDNPEVDWDGEYWVYDMLLTAPSGIVERMIQGAISAIPGVTRPA